MKIKCNNCRNEFEENEMRYINLDNTGICVKCDADQKLRMTFEKLIEDHPEQYHDCGNEDCGHIWGKQRGNFCVRCGCYAEGEMPFEPTPKNKLYIDKENKLRQCPDCSLIFPYADFKLSFSTGNPIGNCKGCKSARVSISISKSNHKKNPDKYYKCECGFCWTKPKGKFCTKCGKEGK